MLRLLCITLLLQSSRVSSFNVLFEEIEIYHNDTNYKAEHAQKVVNKFFHSFQQWFFTITFCEFTYFENRILKYTETTDYGYPVVLLNGCPNMNKTRSKPKINIHGHTAYVITAEELSLDGSEYIVEALVRTGYFAPRATLIFIVNVPVTIESYYFYTMKIHFRLLWSRSITNSVVMLLWSDKLWTYSYNYFLDRIVDLSDIENIHDWLAHQYDDLQGHELRISVFKKIYEQRDAQPVSCNSRLATTVLTRLRASCKAVPPRDGNTVGDLLPNGTATGVTADLIDGYADLEFNSRILKNSYYGYIDTTYPLTQDELCFMVKNFEKQSTFATVIQLISVKSLVLFIFNVIILIVISIIARETEIRIWNLKAMGSVGVTVMDLVKCFIRQTVDVKINAFVFRCLVLMIIMYSLIVDCAIDGIITSAVTYPRYRKELNTLDELLNSNLTLGIHNRHMRMFNRTLSDDGYTILKNRIETLNDKKIREIIEERQFQYALLLRKTDLLYISRDLANQENGRPLFRLIPECPLPCSIVHGLRYGSPYLHRIEDLIYHLYQGGILQHWAKADELKFGSNVLEPEGKELKSLTITNLQELFIVWAFGLVISTLVFIMEIVVHNKTRKIAECVREGKVNNNVLLRVHT